MNAHALADWLKASAAWIGVIVPPITWILYQQGVGELVYVACETGGPPIGPLLGALCFGICGLAGWASWRQRTTATTKAQRFLCRVGAGLALLFALGVLIVTSATLVIPPCAR
jgi:hypothetical protein